MERLMVYPGAIPLETDLLNIQRNTLISISKLSELLFGVSSTVLYGLSCEVTSPPSLQVDIAPGQIYASDSVDVSAFSSLAADTNHTILKQGLLLDKITLNCPAPVTVGYSINYLIQVTFQEVDGTPVVLPYYNASNPAVAYTGPNNSGVAQNTTRVGKCVVSVKAGAAAATGTQTTPAVDAGNTAIYIVTVSYGQTTILSGDITQVVGAPFYDVQLQNQPPASITVETTLTSTNKNIFVVNQVPIHLPSYTSVSADKEFSIKNNSPGDINVDAIGGVLIDGAATLVVGFGNRCRISKDGAGKWQTI